ncbi:GlcNAc-PI de-N-acetylase [Gammaproteobacteria bacterium 45_16_T64]|nr:GlcNAc-PI de-N-acetylase [Gammaproteobacteria bacterium 45_16_T64]
MNTVLVVAPHADDETLGAGGTLLRHIAEGDKVYWLIVSGMSCSFGFSEDKVGKRAGEIEKVSAMYGFSDYFELGFPPAALDTLAKADIIEAVSSVVKSVKPSIIYTVFRNDAHSDHEVVFDAVISSTKSFRYPFVKRVLSYETISETDFGLKPEDGGFRPNVFVDVSSYLDRKLQILSVFESEMGEFPFPRSVKAVSSLACIRGIQANSEAAEAFMLIKEIS